LNPGERPSLINVVSHCIIEEISFFPLYIQTRLWH
jgi:hypothetical protein